MFLDDLFLENIFCWGEYNRLVQGCLQKPRPPLTPDTQSLRAPQAGGCLPTSSSR